MVSFFLVTLVRFKCARNSRVDNVSRPWVYLTLWPLSPNRGLCTLMWMHLFINLSPMGPLSHVSSSLQVGWVLRLGFAVVGWFRRFRLPPPPLVWFRFRRPPFFHVFPSLALSGFARSGPGVSCWCLLFPSSLAFPSSRPG